MSLRGVRVLDFCWVGAGAFVTRILSDLGADVIKVESRSHPDNLRLSGPHAPGAAHLEGSGYFAMRNTGKRSIALNMQNPAARDIAGKLAENVTLVTNNFRPGIMERWGLDYQTLRQRNPGLIFLSMPMQGKSGPHRDFVGFGSTIAALTGLVEMAGVPGRPPVGTGTHYPDHIPNPGHALVAVLSALWHRRQTGQGQEIELAQIESTISLLGSRIISKSAGIETQAPTGNSRRGSAPRGVYPAMGTDSWIAIEITSDLEWDALATVLAFEGMLADPALRFARARQARASEIDRALRQLTATYEPDALARQLQALGVPAAKVSHAGDVLMDEQLRSRNYWSEVPHPEMRMLLTNAAPFKKARVEREPQRTAPLLGEHTAEVIGEMLGLSEAEIQQLINDRVLY